LTPKEVKQAADRLYRLNLKTRALRAVTDFWFPFCDRPIGCFDCGESDVSVLTFDHVDRKSTSPGKGAPASARHLEAIQHPERLQIRCAPCHWKKEKKDFARHGFKADAASYQQVTLLPWRTEVLERKQISKVERVEAEGRIHLGGDKWIPVVKHADRFKLLAQAEE
jgi:hypothetical protein